LERTRKFFFLLKSLVSTQSSQDKEKFSCPFQSTDNFPEWKLAFSDHHSPCADCVLGTRGPIIAAPYLHFAQIQSTVQVRKKNWEKTGISGMI
jgi:hypothetical protein